MRLYNNINIVEYLPLPFDILFSVLILSPLYQSDECWMIVIACIFTVVNSLSFFMSAESAVSHMIVDPFVILISDNIVS